MTTAEPTCECLQPGFCERRGCTIPGIHFRKCQAGQVVVLDQLYADQRPPEKFTGPQGPVLPKNMPEGVHGDSKTCGISEPVGTALKVRIEKLITVKTGKGCGCQNLVVDMDRWGIAGCEQRREEIITHLVNNRDVLVEALRTHGTLGHAAGWVAGMLPDIMLRAGARLLLDQAIADVQAAKTQRVHTRRAGSNGPYTGWKSEADGPMIPHGPFVSTIRHLTYFVYPRTEDSWKWNLQQLASRWWLFNGTRILGIAHDNESASPDVVTEYAASLGMVFDHVLTAPNNKKLREVVLFADMIQLLHPESAGPDEVVFSGHAKGQKYDDPAYTRDWADVMYRVNLDHWDAVKSALSTSLFTGAFREYGLFHRGFDWIYSGTFYWWRLAAIGKRQWNVDQFFGGTESWPGKICDPRETSCLFMNDSKRLYEKNYWKTVVWPAWYKREALLAQSPEPEPFISEPVIHFGAHLYPVKGKWHWHAERWNEIAANVNGLCIVGVATSATTDTIDDVRAKLSDRFLLVQMPNSAEGESPTFRMLQERVPQGIDDVLLYAHGKGVTSKSDTAEAIRIWSEIMYETVIHNTPRVIQKLAEGYKSFGSFRTFRNGWNFTTDVGHGHYAGTFFAVRAKHLSGKPVRSEYHGVESWCGDHMPANESWCEFDVPVELDFGIHAYHLDAIYGDVVNQQLEWEVRQVGGPRCEQHKRELDWFLEKLSPASHVLVIGSRNGGLEYQLQKCGHTTVSIDIAPQSDNTVENMIVGNSMDHGVQAEAIRQGPYDVAFIDGDHSYNGVSEDWSFVYHVLYPRLIAFHDIAVAFKHHREGCHVDQLWAEIKASGVKTDEKIVGCGWGGIGVVML